MPNDFENIGQWWGVIAEWVNLVLTLPDPPPAPLTYANDAVMVTAISVLASSLSAEVGDQVREALAPVINAVVPPASGLSASGPGSS